MHSNPASPLTEPIVGALRVIGGARLEDRAVCATALTPPPRVARGREGDHLFILLDLTGPASPHLYRELREVVAQAYWSTTGSITAALRQAAVAANRYLFRINLRSTSSDRCGGNLVCAVLRGDGLFILQAGSARACFLHRERLECFSPGEELSPLGIGRLADVRLYHTFIAPGDVLLLASSILIREAGDAGLARVLLRGEVQAVLDGLEQVGAGTDFAALVVRWTLPGEPPAAREAPHPMPSPRISASPRPEPATSVSTELDEVSVEPPSRRAVETREPSRPRPRARPKPAGPGLGKRVADVARVVGRGIAAAGVGLVGGMGTLFRRMLPGPEREARRRARASRRRPPRPVPKENRTVMMATAIGIPVVLAVIVALAYLSFGADARFRNFIKQAEKEVELAQAAGGVSEEARSHWEAVLDYSARATELRLDDPVGTALQAQAQAALDLLDGIARLQPVQLWDFRPGTVPRQLIVQGQMIFVLDPAEGWVAQLTLNPTGDGVVEQGDDPILVQTRQQVGGEEVGNLVDFAWVDPGGERQTSGLLILEEDGALLSYDPAWVDEGGAPRLTRSLLGTPPAGVPRVVGSFGGRFYILDAIADQVWRYDPRGDVYPEQPDRCFVVPPPRPLADVLDMAIDGNVYVLHQGGTIIKFLRGEPQVFEVSGLPGDLSQAVALAVDQDGGSGVVYVADRGMAERGSGRVVALGSDGIFQAQFCADEALNALESLAVDEAAGRLYVISGGRLYVASLP